MWFCPFNEVKLASQENIEQVILQQLPIRAVTIHLDLLVVRICLYFNLICVIRCYSSLKSMRPK